MAKQGPVSLVELARMGGELQVKQDLYERLCGVWLTQVEPCGATDFERVLDLYRKNVLFALMTREKHDPVEWAADEVMRAAITGENGLDFAVFPGFLAGYTKMKSAIYKGLDGIEDLGRGDDGFGDLCDSIPLAGVGVIRLCAKKGHFKSNEDMEDAVRAECVKYVTAWVKIPWREHGGENLSMNVEKIAAKWAKFILEGENYNRMKLEDEWKKRFAQENRKQILHGTTDSPVGDDEGFVSFLDDAVKMLLEMWDARGGRRLDVDEIAGIRYDLDVSWGDKRGSRR